MVLLATSTSGRRTARSYPIKFATVMLSIGEVLIWAGFDSDPRFPSIVPHCAFENPNCTDPAACRVNVDTRAYAFFDD